LLGVRVSTELFITDPFIITHHMHNRPCSKRQKKNKYSQRVIDIEKSLSFNPFVFTTSGGMAPEYNRVNKRPAEKKLKNTGSHICICHDIH